MKQKEKSDLDTEMSTEAVIRDREELAAQIRALKDLQQMAASYGLTPEDNRERIPAGLYQCKIRNQEEDDMCWRLFLLFSVCTLDFSRFRSILGEGVHLRPDGPHRGERRAGVFGRSGRTSVLRLYPGDLSERHHRRLLGGNVLPGNPVTRVYSATRLVPNKAEILRNAL